MIIPIDAEKLKDSVKRMVGKCAYIDTKLMLNLIDSMPRLTRTDLKHLIGNMEDSDESSK